ncbi:hypothetical protein [Emticicia sp.]|uniref:hypothetical protein n=1 Tax=Emticicia sp. TaxID=1930953 RepID=UPI00375294A2
MLLIKDFISNAITKPDLKSLRPIYTAMGKSQKSFNNMLDDGDMKLTDFIKFCEITKVNPADLFEDEAVRLAKKTNNCQNKLIKVYELLLKHGIKFDFED